MQKVICVPAGNALPAHLETGGGDAVAELVRGFEAQHLLDGGADEIGLGDEPAPRLGPFDQEPEAVADEVRRRLVAGVEDEDAVLQQLRLGQPLAARLALDEPGQEVLVGIAGAPATLGNETLEIGEEVDNGAVAVSEPLRRRERLERAEDRERPAAQRPALAARHVEEVADDLDRDCGGEIVDEVDLVLFLGAVEEPVDEAHDAVLHAGDGARVEGAGENAPDARVQRRVVEDEARRVMLVERRRAVFGAELDGLVRAENLRVLVDALAVGVARDQDLPGIEAVDRIVLAQRRIVAVGVVVEAGRQALEAEAPRHLGG